MLVLNKSYTKIKKSNGFTEIKIGYSFDNINQVFRYADMFVENKWFFLEDKDYIETDYSILIGDSEFILEVFILKR